MKKYIEVFVFKHKQGRRTRGHKLTLVNNSVYRIEQHIFFLTENNT